MEEMAAIAEGARLAGILPTIQSALLKMEDACVVRMDQMMMQGKLNPDLAQMAWIELLGYRRLRRRFEQQVRVGQALGERNKDLLTGDLPLPI